MGAIIVTNIDELRFVLQELNGTATIQKGKMQFVSNEEVVKQTVKANNILKEIEQQIEKMECCGNCEYDYEKSMLFWEEDFVFHCGDVDNNKCDKWELSE